MKQRMTPDSVLKPSAVDESIRDHRGIVGRARRAAVIDRATASLAALALLFSAAAAADDRDLLRNTSEPPFVFIVFDTSGSMHWTPQCTAESLAAGDCDNLCEQGDCYAQLNGDDPASKFYQAKEALHEVLETVTNVNFGFATYNQDRLDVRAKHWMYSFAEFEDDGVTPNQGIALDSGTRYPAAGAEEVFGWGWDCDNGNNASIRARGCRSAYPADLDDPWELRRVRLLPKHCSTQGCTRRVFIRDDADDKVYRVTYWQDDKDAWPYGADKYRSRLRIERCDDTSDCSPNTDIAEKYVYYDLVDEFLAWDNGANRGPVEQGFFSQGEASDQSASDTCDGLDLNDDEDSDRYPNDSSDYNLRWPTDDSDPRNDPDNDGVNETDLFDSGDLIPLDWENDNKAEIMARLAPGTRDGQLYFGVSGYFYDDREGTCSNDGSVCFKDTDCAGSATCTGRDSVLNLKNENQRPIISDGSTPLGASIADFRTWYSGCPSGTCDQETGWEDEAAVQDVAWACRKKYLLVLTDGDETCGGNPCSGTADLFQQGGVETYVVAFGVEDSEDNTLRCMAANGGTNAPIYPQNKQQLVDALVNIFNEIQVEARSFASASVPAIQSSTADKIFLSSFTPLPDVSFWPGRIDAFRKPLPLTADNRPNVDEECADLTGASDDLQSACHIWEAGEMLCKQAPESVDRVNSDTRAELRLGDAITTERRVVYGRESGGTVPNQLQLFDLPPIPENAGDTLDPITEDFLVALDPDQLSAWQSSSLTPAALKDYFMDVLEGTLEIKVIDPSLVEDVEGCDLSLGGEGFILGDVFHANPTSISSPSNPTYFANNTKGYRDFARKHFWRRKMLVAGTNDGQLHFFDSGIRQVVENDFTTDPTDFVELYNDGSGHELLSYIPRAALPILENQVRGTRHVFSLDNTVATGDVYIDPTDDDTDDTQWRSVLVGSMREAGDVHDTPSDVRNLKASYFALDITQPDILNPRQDANDPTYVPCPKDNPACDDTTTNFAEEYTPSCLDFTSSVNGSQTTPSQCDFPFPVELWTFADSVELSGVTYYLDEDTDAVGLSVGNAIPDLADTWSRPVIGQIQVCAIADGACDPDSAVDGADVDLELRQVAIFGGGMDPDNKGAADVGGNFLYIVDVESGKAIYKRELKGSAAGDPAVIDEDGDGVFDRIYIGTTDGLLYKVDLTARTAIGLVPGFDDPAFEVNEDNLLSLDADGNATRYTDHPGGTVTVQLDRISDPAWDPFVILDTGGPYESPARRGSPIYHAPAAFFIPERNQYGLAIGTGDREDLWDEFNGEDLSPGTDPNGGLFFVFVDDDLTNDPTLYNAAKKCDERLPITQACLKEIAFDVDPTELELFTDYLLAPETDVDLLALEPNPRRGWVMTLDSEARVTAEGFVVAGIVIFSAFEPFTTPTSDAVCARTGVTRAFVVSLQNGSPVAPLGGDDDADPSTTPPNYGERAVDRYHEIGDFTTAPFVDTTATKNPTTTSKTLLDEIDDEIADAVRNSLIDQFPRGSRFNKAFSLLIAALRSSTGVSVYANVPIAVYPADWKDP